MSKRNLLRPEKAKSSQIRRNKSDQKHYVVHCDEGGLELLEVLWLLDVLQFNQVNWESSDEYVAVDQYEADDEGNLVEVTSAVAEEEEVAVEETSVFTKQAVGVTDGDAVNYNCVVTNTLEHEPVNTPAEEPAPAPEPAPSNDHGWV